MWQGSIQHCQSKSESGQQGGKEETSTGTTERPQHQRHWRHVAGDWKCHRLRKQELPSPRESSSFLYPIYKLTYLLNTLSILQVGDLKSLLCQVLMTAILWLSPPSRWSASRNCLSSTSRQHPCQPGPSPVCFQNQLIHREYPIWLTLKKCKRKGLDFDTELSNKVSIMFVHIVL